MGCPELITPAPAHVCGIDTIKTLLRARGDVGAAFARIGEVEKIASPGQTIGCQFLRIWKSLRGAENGYPLVEIERSPVEGLDFVAGQAPAIWYFKCAEVAPELWNG